MTKLSLISAFSASLSLAAPALSENMANFNSVSFIPSLTFTLKNTYEGETYPVTSETWVFENRCDNVDWMGAFGQIAALEMNDYKVGYSDLSVDVTIMTPNQITKYPDLTIDEVSWLFINTAGLQGPAITDHAEAFLPKQCTMIS
jgi:hypothetical protein